MSTDLKKKVKGELTAFLSLVFLLLLSLVGSVLESASIQVMKNERRADASRAMESIFAEYQRELFDEYGILAIEGSYESGEFSESGILNRLSYYGAENLDMEISQVRYLTDLSGKGFFEQAVELEKENTGMALIEDLMGDIAFWEKFDNKWEVYEKEDKETSEELNQMLQENEMQLPDENNPIQVISDLKSMGIQSVVLPEDFTLSDKQIDLSSMPSGRTLREGNWTLEEEDGDGSLFFNLYFMDHFAHALESEEEKPLSYELEYLLEGKESDKENLCGALQKICKFRFGVDYLYLLSDSEKQAEARAFAGTLCTLLTIPGITEIAAQAVLLAWAYGEAVMDVRTLMNGGKVTLVKDKSTWKLSLEGLLHLTDHTEDVSGGDEKGLSYKDYLRIMLFFKNKTTLSMRGLDLIEGNLRTKFGKEFFRVDNCILGLKIKTVCALRRGVTYDFVTKYEYQ